MKLRLINSIIILFVTAQLVAAQTGVYIPEYGEIVAHNSDTIAIFSNIENNGRFGSFKGSVVNFYGSYWKNGFSALMPDQHFYNDSLAANGGRFRFINNPASLGEQYVDGGYNARLKTGATFPNLIIENANGLYLNKNDLKIRDTIQFNNGNIFLSNNTLTVGNNYPGVMSGYTDKKFVVTGKTVDGGFLLRESLSNPDGLVVYPIGVSADEYTPFAMQNHDSIPDDFYVRVFNNVYQKATYGSLLPDLHVNKTWNLHRRTDLHSNISLFLQHEESDEDEMFKLYRDSSYISLYQGNSNWDTTLPTGLIRRATLTTGTPVSGSFMNFRYFYGQLSSTNFLSVAAKLNNNSRARVHITLNAWRTTIRYVQANWFTYSEVNLDHFELQRRREEESAFSNIAIVPATSSGGGSVFQQQYSHVDDNLYDRYTYYRVKCVGRDGSITFSNTVAVPNFIRITVTPNPSDGKFRISIFGIRYPIRMQIVSAMGQLLHTQTVSDNTTINRSDLAGGMYFLTFFDPQNNNIVIDTKKLEIAR